MADSLDRDIWILHLSDLHLGDTPGHLARVRIRFGEAQADWRCVAGVDWPDACVITGDLTATGSQGEFAMVSQFIADVRAWMGGPARGAERRVFVVPGNHDQMRDSLRGPKLPVKELKQLGYVRLCREGHGRSRKYVYLHAAHPCFSRADKDPVAASNVWANTRGAWDSGVRPSDPDEGANHGYNIIRIGPRDSTRYRRAWAPVKQSFEADARTGADSGVTEKSRGYLDAPLKHEQAERYSPRPRPSGAVAKPLEGRGTGPLTKSAVVQRLEYLASQPDIPELTMMLTLSMWLDRNLNTELARTANTALLGALHKGRGA